MRKRFAIAVISIPRAASCFYKKPIRSEVWTHKEAPSLNPAHNVGLKDFIDLHAEPYILVLCVCPCFEPSGLNIYFVFLQRWPRFPEEPTPSTPSATLLHKISTKIPLWNMIWGKSCWTGYNDAVWPLTPPALDSVYKVPTLLISAPFYPRAISSPADQAQPKWTMAVIALIWYVRVWQISGGVSLMGATVLH